MGVRIPDRQLCELDARDWLGEEYWKFWKLEYDNAMAYRKTLKGKPTEEQRVILEINAQTIDFCDRLLWHSARMARDDRCVCKSCDEQRKIKAEYKLNPPKWSFIVKE